MVYEGLLVKKVSLLTIEGFNFYFLRQKLSLLNWSVIKVTGRRMIFPVVFYRQ